MKGTIRAASFVVVVSISIPTLVACSSPDSVPPEGSIEESSTPANVDLNLDVSLQSLIDCMSEGGITLFALGSGDDSPDKIALDAGPDFDQWYAHDYLNTHCFAEVEQLANSNGLSLERNIMNITNLFDEAAGGFGPDTSLQTSAEPCPLTPVSTFLPFDSLNETDFSYFVERAEFEWGDDPRERFIDVPVSEGSIESEQDRDFVQVHENGELLRLSPVLESESCFKTVGVNIKFRAKPQVEGGQYEDGCRTLVTTNGSRRDLLGFSVFMCQGSPDWPESFIKVWISSGRDGVEGYERRYDRFNEFDWNELSIKFRFGLDKPRVEVAVNESVYNVLLVERGRANPERIRKYLSSGDFGLWIGGHPDDDYLDHPADLQLDIDSIGLTFGSQPQDSSRLASLLDEFRGTSSIAKQSELAVEFISSFDFQWDEVIGPAVLNFLSAFEQEQPLFTLRAATGLNLMTPAQRLTYTLKQWVLDDLSSKETGSLAFQESDSFPGAVSPRAPRREITVAIDGDYETDPNFYIASQETVLRSTGQYVAPGELVSIDIPSSAAGAGLVARVGIHYADLERYYSEFTRFPRISRTFKLDETKTIVDNPLGGALYIEVPDGSALGKVRVGIDGAVEMPTFSGKDLEGANNDVRRYQELLRSAQVPWFEIVGQSFALTYPIGMSHNYLDPLPLLEVWNRALTDVNIMAGRPLERFREEWIAMDSQPITNLVPWPVANPSFGFFTELEDFQEAGSASSVYDKIQGEGFWNPRHLLEVDEAFLRDSGIVSVWHEWGHLNNLPTPGFEAGICQEVESNVHLLAAVVYNKTLGLSIDKALRYSGFQDYDLSDAALDTMFSPSWQADERMCFDEWDNEMRYQTRSWARLVEIAGLFGWEAVGEIHRVFYSLGTAEMDDQETIALGSKAININLAPIFEFWGVPADRETLAAVADLPAPTDFKSRLQEYRSRIPTSRAEHEAAIEKLSSTTGSMGRWDFYRENYDPELQRVMLEKIDRIIDSIG